jgi:hypothetical protein
MTLINAVMGSCMLRRGVKMICTGRGEKGREGRGGEEGDGRERVLRLEGLKV